MPTHARTPPPSPAAANDAGVAAIDRPAASVDALPDATPDGFEILDVCHRQTLFSLGKMAALMTRLSLHGPDDESRRIAREIVGFFSTTARQHHEDEERHVFPKLATSPDPEVVQAVQRLQQDHGWLEEDWRQLAPQLDAVAAGQSWVDLDLLRDGAEVFIALMHDHMTLEESMIYPRARGRADAGERRAMGREMAARRRAR